MTHTTHNPAAARPTLAGLFAAAAASALVGLAAAVLSEEELAMLKSAEVAAHAKAHDDRQKAKIADLTAERDAIKGERDQLKADADAEQAGLQQIDDLANADAPAAEVPAADPDVDPAAKVA